MALAKAAGLTLLWLAFYLLPVAEQMKNQVFKVTSNPLTYISERSYPIVSLFINSLKSSVFHAKTANLGTLLFVGLVVAVVSLASKNSEQTVYWFDAGTLIDGYHAFSLALAEPHAFKYNSVSLAVLGILSVMLAFSLHKTNGAFSVNLGPWLCWFSLPSAIWAFINIKVFSHNKAAC